MKSVKFLGIIFFICVWLRLDWIFGMRSLKRQRNSSVYPWRKGNFEFYDDGVAWMKALELDIMEAKNSICLLFYIIEPDEVGRRIFTMLKERAQEGVHIRILADALGSKKMKQWLKPLQREGIEIGLSRPLVYKGSFFSLQRRNHRKIAVIDGEIAHIGGFNIGREYVNLDPVLSPWRDYHLRFTGEGVQDALNEFEIDWKREFPDSVDGLVAAVESQNKKNTVKHQIVPSEPVNMEGFMLGLFKQAEQSIFIGTPYFIPTSKLFEDLKTRIKSGINVTILVPANPDHVLVQPASYHYFRELLDAGAAIYQYQNGFYHAKVVLIDKKICDIGTTNFDRRSLLINDEINVVTHDHTIINRVVTSIEKDLQQSTILTKEHLKPDGIGASAKEWISRTISHLL
ncbi:cardiolipin synthase [Jeotgalibacillus sp. S-D1]|uniref:phospholipase D-like domain-containing protein n=1 Tax=Jeotgalibacillus sp. S-D1 TaxID=2552189 RepID=UPI00105987FD|nr:phospholipase D-like domain-containing protein [Jeotgalibacillus sp. S-D1]TDL32969.1 cardiolipin synthase [Jeotgalibacillus sp. S-D1]